MRISTSAIYDANVAALGQQQTSLLKTQQQVATGRRIQTASDDPVAAARAISVNQADAMNTQYGANRTALRHTLSLAESNLQSVTYLLQDVHAAVVNAGNGSFTDYDRRTIATELGGKLQELIGFANSTDGVGNYLFSGFQSGTQPFADVAGTITYNGDDGQRLIQANASRQIASSDSGADVFMRVKNGNGAFVTQPAATNTGTGIVSIGSVSDATLLTGNNYSVVFTVTPGVAGAPDVTTYSVAAAVPPVVNNPYVSGQAINFDGMQFDIQGVPANGDIFTVTPSTNESIFKTVSDLIAALNTPAATAANGGTTGLVNSLSRGIKNLDNVLNNILSIRSSLGLRLQEVDALQTAGDDLGLQFKDTLAQLQDVDPYKAYSDLTQQNTTLQASLKSFAAVSNLSLFSYI
ncbi:MAG: flagellar hook-associated protein FlgL [Nitrosomonadales bacterium]|nr:flagellar hook-associated protein FlgL [Nitrosomonadales bacterium]